VANLDKLVVTGASGLLGFAVVLAARQRNRDVVTLSHRQLVRIPGAVSLSFDLADHAAVREFLCTTRPNAIIHCAAATNVDWCEEHSHEAMRINAEASSVLAEAAFTLGAQFVYISTDSVFDGRRGLYSEYDEPAPVNAYARSKLAGEEGVLRRHSSAIVARVTLYGWNAQPKQCLAEWMWNELRQGREVAGFMDVFFTPVQANDLAEVLLDMLDRKLAGVFHVGAPERISKYDFARRLAGTFGFAPEQVTRAHLANARLKAQRPADPSLRTGKIQAALGRAMPGIDSGLRRFRELWDSGEAQQWKSFVSGAAA